MNAMQFEQRYPIEVRAEARRIADVTGADYEDLPGIEAAVAADLYLRAIRPLVDAKVSISLVLPPVSYVVCEGSLQLLERVIPPAAAAAIRSLDEMIEAEAVRYGVKEQKR